MKDRGKRIKNNTSKLFIQVVHKFKQKEQHSDNTTPLKMHLQTKITDLLINSNMSHNINSNNQ